MKIKYISIVFLCILLIFLYKENIIYSISNNGIERQINGIIQTESEYDSVHPVSFKIDNGYILFWEEVYSSKKRDIQVMKIDDDGKAAPNTKINISNNEYQSQIVSIVPVNNKYYILSKEIKDGDLIYNDGMTYGEGVYNFYINIYDSISEEITNKLVLHNGFRIIFDDPSFCFDFNNKHFVMIYTMKVFDEILTSKLYLQKYDVNWQKITDALLLTNDEDLKVEPKIIPINNKYNIFFRKHIKTNQTAIYYLEIDESMFEEQNRNNIPKPLLISCKGINVYDYKVFQKNKDECLLIWNDYRNYYYKYISSEKTEVFKIPIIDKSKYLSNIVQSESSYVCTRIVKEFGEIKLLMDIIDFKEIDFDKDIRLLIFAIEPDYPYLLSYEDEISVFWCEKINKIYQIGFKKLNF